MGYDKEYLQLLDLLARVVESMKGVEVSEEHVWMTDTQPSAVKLFYHLGSIYYLANGTSLPRLAGVDVAYVDYPSIVVLVRAAFESYLSFYFIFVAPSSNEERQFRHRIWELGGLLDRQSFPATLEESKQKLADEKILADELTQRIKASPFYAQLDSDTKREARSGKWRIGHSWADVAELAHFDRDYFKHTYSYLCSYAHTGNLSVLQVAQTPDRNTQIKMADTWLGLGLVIMAHFIFAYISIYPDSKAVLSAYPDAARTADVWQAVGTRLSDENSGG